jgi:large subunit ribosomal protein L4
MIDIQVYNESGESTGTVQIDEQQLGGEVRPQLLKQAYVRYHANRRSMNTPTKTRSDVEGSTRKLYRQKGTGNARRGDRKANILRGGGHAKAKTKHRWRQDMPTKMRRLANRNALLAKAVDGEIKLIDLPDFDAPSTKRFNSLLKTLGIDRTCLLALSDTRTPAARSADNIADISVTQIDRLNAYDLLSHRYLLVPKAAFEAYLQAITSRDTAGRADATDAQVIAAATEETADAHA